MSLKLFVFALLLLLTIELHAQDWVSPCPRLFVYEGKSNVPNRWYGIITLLTDNTLTGIWMRVKFDRPIISLGNWLGEVVDKGNNTDFLIKNRKVELQAQVPKVVRFYVDYDSNNSPPQLVEIKLNAKVICPEPIVTEAPPATFELKTSKPLGDDPSSVTPKQHEPPRDSEEICGTVIKQPTALITYGQATTEGEFPWHIALYHTKGLAQTYICGGSLITKFHVLTAGHCITKPRSETPVSPENFVVYLGKYSLKRFGNVGIQDREVSEVIAHPMYSARTYKNDIAVLKLATKVDFTDYVRPICLWRESNDIAGVVDKQGTVIGWGVDENGKLSEELMQAKMPIVSDITCIRSYPEFYSRFTSSETFCAGFKNGTVIGWGVDENGKLSEELMQAKMPIVSDITCIRSYPEFYSRFTSSETFCAGFKNGTSVCNGDSGGGMVFPRLDSKNVDNPVWHLRGLVSLSVVLQGQCDTSNYVVFTDVAKYLDWIRTLI